MSNIEDNKVKDEIEAIVTDGSDEYLKEDKLYQNDLIDTGVIGTVLIDNSDETAFEIAGGTQMALDNESFNLYGQSVEEAEQEVATLQQRLIDGDSILSLPAAAAGVGMPAINQGSSDGHDFMLLLKDDNRMTPKSGFDTIENNTDSAATSLTELILNPSVIPTTTSSSSTLTPPIPTPTPTDNILNTSADIFISDESLDSLDVSINESNEGFESFISSGFSYSVSFELETDVLPTNLHNDCNEVDRESLEIGDLLLEDNLIEIPEVEAPEIEVLENNVDSKSSLLDLEISLLEGEAEGSLTFDVESLSVNLESLTLDIDSLTLNSDSNLNFNVEGLTLNVSSLTLNAGSSLTVNSGITINAEDGITLHAESILTSNTDLILTSNTHITISGTVNFIASGNSSIGNFDSSGSNALSICSHDFGEIPLNGGTTFNNAGGSTINIAATLGNFIPDISTITYGGPALLDIPTETVF